MMELVFVACLGAEPLNCETKAMQFADMSAMACLMCAQQVLAQWGNEHPGWNVQRWTCQPKGRSVMHRQWTPLENAGAGRSALWQVPLGQTGLNKVSDLQLPPVGREQ